MKIDDLGLAASAYATGACHLGMVLQKPGAPAPRASLTSIDCEAPGELSPREEARWLVRACGFKL